MISKRRAFSFILGLFLVPFMLSAAPGWRGNAGKAAKPAEISEVETERGKAIKVSAVSDGPYQSATLHTAYPVSLEDGGKITYDLRQAVRGTPIAFALIVNYANNKSAIRHSSSGTPGKWTTLEFGISKDADYKGEKNAPVPPGKITMISVYPFAAMDKTGQNYEIASFQILDANAKEIDYMKASLQRSGEELAPAYIKAEYWKGESGQAKIAPEVSISDTPYGPAVFIKAQGQGKYQGASITFPEPVDLSEVGSLEFDFYQNVRPNLPGDVSVILKYDAQRTGLMGNAKYSPSDWNHVSLPIDLRTLRALSKQSTPVLGKVKSISFSLYSSMSQPGHTIAFANIRFLPRKSEVAPIRVSAYSYVSKPTSGDTTQGVLTDGQVIKADQAFYRVYADEPEIIFDLGAVYLVKSISVSAVAVPSQNISDYTVYTSNDGKNFRTAAYIANSDTGATEKKYDITGKELNIAGRYVKIRMGRSRTDFPINIAEVAFTGKIPTDAELASVAAAAYTVGPQMPHISNKDYLFLKGADNMEIAFSRKNGVGCQLKKGQELLAERVFNRYDLFGEKAAPIGKADGYTDQVRSIQAKNGGVEIVTVNPAMPALEFTCFYSFTHGNLSRKLTIKSSNSAKRIFYTALSIVLPRAIRNGGLYETWGSGHDLQHKFASEILFDYPADTASAMIFESPNCNKCYLSFRYRYNDRYIQIGSGTVTVSGFGEKRTIFTPNGWIMNDGVFAFNDQCLGGSVESMLSVAEGDITNAFDQYLALPEVKSFRSAIRRPQWLRQLRMLCTQGWDGLYGDTGKRIAGMHASLIREGYVHYGANDSDYYWGDFPTSGTVRNIFGGQLTAEQMRERSISIHREYPNVKISQYTWLWSVSPQSKPFRQHPEWFNVYNAQGQTISFFPGWGPNYYRLVGIPESRDEIIGAITKFISYYDNDVWYLDGGGSPASIDWHNMRIDPPDAYDRLYLSIRNRIQKENPDRAVFFNNPEAPLGDLGYLESFGGVMTTNWRDGATWMYKFKLWQRPDPLFTPLYIYWLPGVDHAFRQYAVGTGLNLTMGGSSDRRRDVGIIQAQYQSHFAKLVKADVSPNWRYDADTRLELMPLTIGKSGWLFTKNHDAKPYAGPTEVALEPLGVTDARRPVYRWCFTLLDHKDHKGLLGERELEDNYRSFRWASDFIVKSAYQGVSAWTPKARQNVQVAPDQLKLFYFTQSPAVVYSVDALRMQLLLDATLGVEVSGTLTRNAAHLEANSTRNEAEIACIIPQGMIVAKAEVNGSAVPVETVSDAATRLALVSVAKGRSDIRLTFEQTPATPAKCVLQLKAGAPGKELSATWDKAGASALALYDATTLVRNLPLSGKETEARISLPTGITGNTYIARLLAPDGTILAEESVKLAAGRPRIPRFRGPANGEMKYASQVFESPLTPASGIKVLAAYSDFQPINGAVTLNPEEASISVQTHPMYESMWNTLYAGLEVELKRYVKVRLTGNFIKSADGPRHGPKSLSSKYDNPNSALGIMFDFADSTGKYARRVLASVGLAQPKRDSRQPRRFGAARIPDAIGVISSFAVDNIPEETFWIDLKMLGAPEDWSGKTMVSEVFDNITPNRQMAVQLLESRDSLPDGVTAQKFYWTKGGKGAELKRYKLPAPKEKVTIDAKLDEKEWKNALRFTEFSRTGNPAKFAPPTLMMLRRDGDFICLAAEFTEPRQQGFTTDKTSKPWFNDGIEIYLQSQDAKPSYVQHIISGADTAYSHWVAGIGAGKTNKILNTPETKVRLDGKRLIIEAKIPLKDLGNLNSRRIRFNLARNRMVDATLEAYTLVPGKQYLNFDGAELEL